MTDDASDPGVSWLTPMRIGTVFVTQLWSLGQIFAHQGDAHKFYKRLHMLEMSNCFGDNIGAVLAAVPDNADRANIEHSWRAMDTLDVFWATLESTIHVGPQRLASSHLPRPVSPKSPLGRLCVECARIFERIEYGDALDVFTLWRKQLLELKENEPILEPLPESEEILDSDSVHRRYDIDAEHAYDRAMYDLAVLKAAQGHHSAALKLAEDGVVLALWKNNTQLASDILRWIWQLCATYGHKLPTGLGTRDQLRNFLDAKETEAPLELLDSLHSGLPAPRVLECVSRAVQAYPTSQLGRFAFHICCAEMWARWGKGELSQSHWRIAKDCCVGPGFPGLAIQKDMRLGQTSQALQMLQDAEAMVGEAAIQEDIDWISTRLLLKARLRLKRLQPLVAQTILQQLRTLERPVNHDVAHGINSLELDILLAQKEFAAAKARALDLAQSTSDVYFNIQYRLVAARALVLGGWSEEADVLAGECVEAAQRASYTPLVIEAHLIQARIAISIGDLNEAQGLCSGVISRARASGDPRIVSEACLLYAEITVERGNDLQQVEAALQRAQTALALYNNCDYIEFDRQLLELQQNAMRDLGIPLGVFAEEDIANAEKRVKELQNGELWQPLALSAKKRRGENEALEGGAKRRRSVDSQ